MSTHDVPGARPENRDVLAMGCWAEHDDGSLIFVEAVEAGRVVYSIFDVQSDPPVEYRDAMPESVFQDRFSWRPESDDADDDLDIRWTWHDKTPFPWERVMADFPAGQRHPSAAAELTAAARVARSLNLRAEQVQARHRDRPTLQRAATTIMRGIREAVEAVRP